MRLAYNMKKGFSLMKSMRFLVSALCALAIASAFAQTATADVPGNAKVAEAAGKYSKTPLGDMIATFEGIVKEFPQNPSAQGWLGFLHLKNNDAKKAIPFLEFAYNANKKDLEVLNNLGNAYMIDGQKDKALLRYNELIVVDQSRFEPYYNLGNIYLQSKDFDKAALMFTKALEKQPRNVADVNNNLGVAYEGAKKYDQAAATYAKSSDMEPKKPTFARNAGAMYYRTGKYDLASKYLERALNNGTAEKQIVLALGDCYSRSGRNTDLETLYTNYNSMFDSDATFHYNMGVIRKKKGDMVGAEESFRKAYALRDADKDTLSNLGVILFNKGEYAEAREIFEKLMGIDPSARNKKNFAAAAARSGDVKAALPIWNAILAANPADIDVRLLVADAAYEMGNTADAMSQYKAVLARKSTSAMALDGVGRCHLRNANYSGAELALRSAISADAKFVPAYNNLAVVLEKMNKRSEAIALLEKALKIEPENADVSKNLKRMRAAG